MRHCAVLGITALGLSLFTAAQAIAEEAPNFEQTGFAFVQKHCVSCHGMQEQNAELALHGFRSAKSVIESRKVWTNVLKMVEAGEMPPEDQPQPTVEEAAAFVKAVRDVFDYADRNAKPDAGRVTMRRLNRTEYRNTIRDLVGVDFDPTEDFPADDIGHGFDNIGDVLTLSPVLMERYLTASENIVAQAIVPNPPPMPKRHLSTRYSEPASANVPMEGNFRRLATDGESPVFTGPINTSYKWDNDGEYVFRVRVYAQTAGDKPVIAALLVHGAKLPAPASDDEASKLAGSVIRPVTFLKTFEVKANKPENAEVVEVAVPVIAGRERLAIGLLKPVDGQPPAKLFVEYLALDGPLDTRPASHRRLLACNQEKPQAEQTREILTRFARRAFRRPSTTDEVERLAKLVEASTTSGASWEASMQLALQAILCSPKFLFRMELDDPSQKAAMQPLNEFQLASRMSYFLWSSQPDDELLALAEANQLSANIDAQVRRMLQDPKASSLVQNFAMQWLQIQRLSTFAPDNKLFPQFNEQLRTAMLQETELFFASIMQENRSVIELLDADYTFLNEPLARHYGIADTNGNWMGQKPERPAGQPIRGEQMVRVTLQGRSRGGLLTQASVLTVTSNPTRTSPVKRGRWVLEQLLGAPPPPPPPNVPELPADEQAAAGASLRQRMEAHRKNASCAGCHAKMDPLGFALENYSAIGGFRTKDGTFDIDPTGELPGGRKLQGAEDLKSVLKEQHVQFVRCLTEKMLVYALGRGLEHYDRLTVDRILAGLQTNNHAFGTLMIEIVKSDAFRQRRGTAE